MMGGAWRKLEIAGEIGTIYSSLNADDENRLYFISNGGEIYWSHDLGTSWNIKYRFEQMGFSYVDLSNTPTGYAMKTMGNVLYKTTDGGSSWESYALPFSWSSDIYFLNEHYGWITENWAVSSTMHDSTAIYMTQDGGETWVQQLKLSGHSRQSIIGRELR